MQQTPVQLFPGWGMAKTTFKRIILRLKLLPSKQASPARNVLTTWCWVQRETPHSGPEQKKEGLEDIPQGTLMSEKLCWFTVEEDAWREDWVFQVPSRLTTKYVSLKWIQWCIWSRVRGVFSTTWLRSWPSWKHGRTSHLSPSDQGACHTRRENLTWDNSEEGYDLISHQLLAFFPPTPSWRKNE